MSLTEIENIDALSRSIEAFGLSGEHVTLPGGTQPTFRIGDVVLKHIHDTSLENNHSQDLAQWIADIFNDLDIRGFRVPRPVRTRTRTWLTDDGWTAWSYLSGGHATVADIPACIEAIRAFHKALRQISRHPLLDLSTTAWAVAHRACLGDRPKVVHPIAEPLIDQLYTLRRPVPKPQMQIMHGDLNPENILIASPAAPALIDMSPFWGPVELALAIFANFIGPRCGDLAPLLQFSKVAHFDQFLIRAGIRMLLVMSELGDQAFDDWDIAPEREAAHIIIRFLDRP